MKITKKLDFRFSTSGRYLLFGCVWLNAVLTFSLMIYPLPFCCVHVLWHKLDRNIGNDRDMLDKARKMVDL